MTTVKYLLMQTCLPWWRPTDSVCLMILNMGARYM